MDLQKINNLLEKFYNGATTLEEELFLTEFFLEYEVPEELQVDKELFLYTYNQKQQECLDTNFETKFFDKIEKKSSKIRKIRWITAAASIIIILTLFFNLKPAYMYDTYDNPQLAYIEAKKILLKVSQKLNKGTNQIVKLKSFSKGIEQGSKLKKFNKNLRKTIPLRNFSYGIGQVAKISSLNKAKEKISKK